MVRLTSVTPPPSTTWGRWGGWGGEAALRRGGPSGRVVLSRACQPCLPGSCCQACQAWRGK